jgi:UDPglucose 6-dehydrogenase
MRITIFGSGYVGLVSGACFADAGNRVLCVDIDAQKIERLQRGEVPIHEPGLTGLIERNACAGRLRFTTDAAVGIAHGEVILIAVGTPPDEDGSADLRHVLTVARTIGEHLDGYRIVVDKSTVPVGTADRAGLGGARRGASLRCGLEPGIPQGGRGDRGFHEAGPRGHRHGLAAGHRDDACAL